MCNLFAPCTTIFTICVTFAISSPQYNDHIVSQYPTGLQSCLLSRPRLELCFSLPHRIGTCMSSVRGRCCSVAHCPSFQRYPKSKGCLGTNRKVPSISISKVATSALPTIHVARDTLPIKIVLVSKSLGRHSLTYLMMLSLQQ